MRLQRENHAEKEKNGRNRSIRHTNLTGGEGGGPQAPQCKGLCTARMVLGHNTPLRALTITGDHI